MRALSASVLVPLIAAAGACTTAFGAAPSDEVAPPRPSKSDGGDVTEAGRTDATVVLDGQAPGTELTPPPIGQGCAGRVPPWSECVDFENGELGNTFSTGAGVVSLTTSGGGKVLRALTTSPTAAALRLLNVAENAKRVLWSFDVNVGGGVADRTELATLEVPLVNGDQCFIYLGRWNDKLRVLEHCRIGSDVTENLLAEPPFPTNPDGWFNVFIDANFGNRAVSVTLRWPDSQIKTGAGTLKTAVVTKDARLGLGIAFAPKDSVVSVDNIVLFSQ